MRTNLSATGSLYIIERHRFPAAGVGSTLSCPHQPLVGRGRHPLAAVRDGNCPML